MKAYLILLAIFVVVAGIVAVILADFFLGLAVIIHLVIGSAILLSKLYKGNKLKGLEYKAIN